MSSNKQSTQNYKNCSNESSIGAKSDGNKCRFPSKQMNSTQELDQKYDRNSLKESHSSMATNSHIPRYTGVRQRRHSDSQSGSRAYDNYCDLNQKDGSLVKNVCSIHGIRSPNDMLLYEMLQNMDLNPNQCQIPDQIRVLHKNHVCSNVGKSRSVPTSKMNSVLSTPLSSPSTPIDSRRMSFNRNSLSQTSTPLRQSKSSLSMTSQMTRHSNQKTFAEYMPLCEVQRGLQKGEIVEGVLRINPRNYMDAYISAPEGGLDIYVGGMIDRNRALNGDRVALLFNGVKHWKVLFDIIRIHWDEWGQHFETIIKQNLKSTKIKETPIACAQSSQSVLSLIDEIDESLKQIKNNDLNELIGDYSGNQSNNIECENTNSDLTEPLIECSNGSQKSDKNRKKRRSRKKKSKSNEIEINGSIEEISTDKLSLLKPEIRDSIINNENRVVSKSSKMSELNDKIKQIQNLSVEHMLGLPFWQKFIQKTGRVVAICGAIHSRIAGGRLTHMKDKNQNWALFLPNDSRIPRMRIPMKSCPPDFFHHSQHFSQSLFIVKLEEWKTTDTFPSGVLIQHLGNVGDIEAESELLLLEHSIEYSDFPNEALYGLPFMENDEWMSSDEMWPIPSSELQYRRDFRSECVFTIDPLTARDLDDALSIKQLNEDHFEVGVHIADVSFFLKEGMPLDEIARRRATSVYLVQKVIPMLPKILCEKLCSLNAGEEKLTFSVVWVIDKNGNILEEWFGRTIIKSCIKLSYELAQDMIDSPHKYWNDYELPTIYGKWDYKAISKSVNLLNDIAIKLRAHRFESGALRIDKLKLQFVLDKESGLPSGFSPYVYRNSNQLVEELMLLANMAVAHKIYNTFGDKAFLRCHPPPAEEALNDFKSFCKYNGFEVDTTSSLSLQKSLQALVNNDSNISRVVAHFLLKSMQTAQYICVGMQSAASTLHHYALNVPLYTHFTSPIRRYPDVIVHRLLASALSYRQVIKESTLDLHRLAQHCNDKKLSARLVSENSSKLFLHIFIKQLGKIEAKAIVVQVYDHSFDVMILNCDHICRVYLDQLPLKQFVFDTKHGKNQLILEWNDPKAPENNIKQTIIACLIVKVLVSVNEDESKLTALIRHPNGIFYRKDVLTNQFIES